VTLEPTPLLNGLTARSANGVTYLFLSAERLWGYQNVKTYILLDMRGYEIELGTSQSSPIRWEKREG
jgi:hypothetical protein